MIAKLLLNFILVSFMYTSSSCEIIGNYLYNYGNTPIYIYVDGDYKTYARASNTTPVYIGDYTPENIIRGYYKYTLICSN